ncbi:MAG: glycoside hydrolase family 99-like domain-containing protein [Phycisphaeraceae bacterium]
MSSDMPDKPVFAHLCTWFRTRGHSGWWEMWESSFEPTPHDPERVRVNGQRDIAARDYPLTDVYDSADAHLIEFQLLLMRLAGIDGVIVDWDGRRLNPYRHEALMKLVAHLDAFGMKLALCFEEWCGYWPPGTFADRDAEIAAAQAEAQWMMDELAARPCYAQVRGSKPVFVFRKKPKQWFSPKEWDRVRRPIHDGGGALIFPPDADEAFAPLVDGRFFWVGGFEAERRFSSLDHARSRYAAFLDGARNVASRTDPPLVFGSVVPGFDDTPVWGWGRLPRSAPRYEGERFRLMWEMSIEHEVDAVQIVTWNDWNEGSHIEPSDHFGYAYLEMNKAYAARFKGVTDDVPDAALRLPLEIYRRRKAVEGDGARGVAHSELDEARAALLAGAYDQAQRILESSGKVLQK